MYHARKNPKGNVRRRHVSRETPLPVYLVAKIYGATRSKTLVDTAYAVGVSISYDHLKTILSERANRACHFYRHHNYARWLSVHIRDLLSLPSEHPLLWEEFEAGNFVAAKSHKRFSKMALDQAHEQLNAALKGDGGKGKLISVFIAFLSIVR